MSLVRCSVALLALSVALIPAPAAAQSGDRAAPATDLPEPEDARTVTSRRSYRLMIDTDDLPAGGYRVKAVRPGSPTARMTRVDRPDMTGALEPGDVVTHVNRAKIRTTADCLQAVELSGGRPVELRVYDPRTRQRYDWSVAPVAVDVPNAAHGPAAAARVHAVLVGDTLDADIGAGVQADIDHWAALLTSGRYVHPSRVGTVFSLTGPNCTPEKILAAVRAINSGTNDTVICYCSCHGAHDPRFADADPQSGGHFLALRDRGKGDLMHKTLRDHVYAKAGRLKIVITDACNVPDTADRPGYRLDSVATAAVPNRKMVSPTERLFFQHTGRLDLNSAAKNEKASGLPSGGVYTTPLNYSMRRSDDWAKVLDFAARKATSKNPNQHPAVFENTLRHDATTRLAALLDEREPDTVLTEVK